MEYIIAIFIPYILIFYGFIVPNSLKKLGKDEISGELFMEVNYITTIFSKHPKRNSIWQQHKIIFAISILNQLLFFLIALTVFVMWVGKP